MCDLIAKIRKIFSIKSTKDEKTITGDIDSKNNKGINNTGNNNKIKQNNNSEK